MERLWLQEDDEIEFVDESAEQVAAAPSLCLVRRFLTDRNIRAVVMKERMADVWRPGRGVSITEIEPGLFSFQFYHELDVQKILKQGPWHFDKHLLILGVAQEGIPPQEIPLKQVPFWVQVHDLPIGFMSETVGKGLANFIGVFLEYDEKNNSNYLRSFMRIRVLVDVTEPLKRTKKIRKQGGEARVVAFKYERLEVFCYICGLLGHSESGCEKLFRMGVDDGVRGGERSSGLITGKAAPSNDQSGLGTTKSVIGCTQV